MSEQVLILGSGNAFFTDGRAHACYLTSWPDPSGSGNIRMLVDYGASSLMRMNQEKIAPSSIQSLFLTHFHGDHIGGLPFLLIHFKYIDKRKEPFWILGPQGVESAVRALMEQMYPGMELDFPLYFRELASQDSLSFLGATIETRPVTHRPESVALRLVYPSGKVFAFSGDAALDDLLLQALENTDLCIVELSIEDQPDPKNPSVAHVSLAELIQHRHSIQTRRLVVSHIYDSLAEKVQKLNLERPGFAEPAFDGLVLSL
ncbi:MAG: MBL fold metallo-hydrolase [Leptospiraceae bacterium]